MELPALKIKILLTEGLSHEAESLETILGKRQSSISPVYGISTLTGDLSARARTAVEAINAEEADRKLNDVLNEVHVSYMLDS